MMEDVEMHEERLSDEELDDKALHNDRLDDEEWKLEMLGNGTGGRCMVVELPDIEIWMIEG